MSHFLHQRCILRDYYTLVSVSVKHGQILYFILWLTNILYLMVFETEARHPEVSGRKFTSRTLISSHFSSHGRSPSLAHQRWFPLLTNILDFPIRGSGGGVWQLAAGFVGAGAEGLNWKLTSSGQCGFGPSQWLHRSSGSSVGDSPTGSAGTTGSVAAN